MDNNAHKVTSHIQGQFPLLNTISKMLRGVGGVTQGCGRPAPPVTPAPVLPESTTYDDGSLNGGWKDPLDSSSQSTTTQRTTTTKQTTTTKRTTTTQPPQIAAVEAETEGNKCVEGQYYEYPKDCQKYYFCGNGKLILQACSVGLYWSSAAQMCDWSDSVQCSIDNNNFDNSIDQETEEENDYNNYEYNNGNNYNDYNDNNTDEDCDEGEYNTPAGSCSSFYQCVNGKKTLQNCYEGLHWNKETNTCDWPEAAGCDVSRSALPRAGTCQEGELDSDPSDCSNYLFCVHGAMETYSCQSGTMWDNNLKVCNFPDQVQCSSQSSDNNGNNNNQVSYPKPVKPAIESGVVLVVGDRDSNNQDTINDIINNENTDFIIEKEMIQQDTPSGLSGDYKIVCYFTNWAWYRPGIGKYRAEDVDPSLCTHIVYGFAVLDQSSLQIKPHDTWADIDNSKNS